MDSLFPRKLSGFRRGRSTVDQVTSLTQNIEDTFEAKKKAGAVFIDLTAAYNTVWHRGFTCKLFRFLIKFCTQQAHGPYDYGAYPQQKLHPYNWRQQT